MSQFEAKREEFARMGAEIVGISVDSHFSHRAFAQRKHLGYLLLSDFNREVVGDLVGYHDDVAGYRGVNRRAVLVVDPSLTLRWAWYAESPEQMPDTEEVREAVQDVVYG